MKKNNNILNYFYRPCSLAKQGDNALGSVCPSVSALTPEEEQRKAKEESKVFVCVSSNCADAVDRLLIIKLANCWNGSDTCTLMVMVIIRGPSTDLEANGDLFFALIYTKP